MQTSQNEKSGVQQQIKKNSTTNANKLTVQKQLFYSLDHRDYVIGANFSRCGQYFITGCYDGFIRIWDIAKDCSLFRAFKVHEKILVLSFSRNCKYFATGGNNVINIFRFKFSKTSDDPIFQFKTEEENQNQVIDIQSIAFAPNDELIACGNLNGTVFLYSIVTGEKLFSSQLHSHFVNSIVFSLDSKFIYSGCHEGQIQVYSTETFLKDKIQVALFRKKAYNERGIRAIDVSDMYVAVGWGRFIDIYQVGTYLITANLKGHTREVFCLKFTQSSQLLLSGGWDNTVRVWSTENFQLVQIIEDTQNLGIFTPGLFHSSLKVQQDYNNCIQVNPMEQNDDLKIAILNQSINQNERCTFNFKIQSMSQVGSIAIGVCYKEIVKENNFSINQSKIGHGVYCVTSNGTLLSHHDQQHNNRKQSDIFQEQRELKQKQDEELEKKGEIRGFDDNQPDQFIYSRHLVFQQGDTIICEYVPSIKSINFSNKTNPENPGELNLNFRKIQNKTLHPCVILRKKEDKIQIAQTDSHSDWVKQIGIYPTEKYFCTASRDQTAKIWKLIEFQD